MKKLVIASVIAGAAIVGLLMYLSEQAGEKKTGDDVADAAGDAYKTMNRYVNKEEKAFDPALN